MAGFQNAFFRENGRKNRVEFGLALAGGGTRGAAHVGILKAFLEEGMIPRSIAGTSAGSIVAGLYASGMKIGELEETVVYLSKCGLCYMDPDCIGLLSFIPQILLRGQISLTGLIKGNRLSKLLCELTQKQNLEDISMPLVIPAVDLNSGDTIAYTNFKNPAYLEQVRWEKEGPLCEIMMASSSVPAVFRPRRLGGYCLVDGGVTNNLPVDLLVAAGEKIVVAVDIGVDYEMLHDDSIIEIASHSFSIMSMNLKKCKSEEETFLLRPSLTKGAGLLTFEHMEACMNEGYEYGKRMIPKIRAVLLKKEEKHRSLQRERNAAQPAAIHFPFIP